MSPLAWTKVRSTVISWPAVTAKAYQSWVRSQVLKVSEGVRLVRAKGASRLSLGSAASGVQVALMQRPAAEQVSPVSQSVAAPHSRQLLVSMSQMPLPQSALSLHSRQMPSATSQAPLVHWSSWKQSTQRPSVLQTPKKQSSSVAHSRQVFVSVLQAPLKQSALSSHSLQVLVVRSQESELQSAFLVHSTQVLAAPQVGAPKLQSRST